MPEINEVLRPPGTKGCLSSAAGLAVLALISPFALVVHRWRRWRRGDLVRTKISNRLWPTGNSGEKLQRLDAEFDVPLVREAGFGRRLTDVVVRIAEALRRPDDVYNMVYRLPLDEEAVTLPVGPQLQALGERFFLVLNQGPLAGRTVVWLTLGPDRALAEVVESFTCDPEADGQPDGLLATPGARWTLASEWARVGPSLVIRLVVVVPAARADRIHDLLSDVC